MEKDIIIVDYGVGNLSSICYALDRIGACYSLSSDPREIRNAKRVLLPGVGEASTAMDNLKSSGLDQLICKLKQPVLGICLGMQLMCKSSEEGNVDCLGIFPNRVVKFPRYGQLKVPHVGWNQINTFNSNLLNQIEEQSYVYFTHSYYVESNQYTIAHCQYIVDFSAMIEKDNFFGCQFHPERSGDIGERILENFIERTQLSK